MPLLTPREIAEVQELVQSPGPGRPPPHNQVESAEAMTKADRPVRKRSSVLRQRKG